jgi:hypothetical protein
MLVSVGLELFVANIEDGHIFYPVCLCTYVPCFLHLLPAAYCSDARSVYGGVVLACSDGECKVLEMGPPSRRCYGARRYFNFG